MLEEIAAEREWELERVGKRANMMEAPEIDFSPVVLCLFKAIEIEIERKIFRPFRESMPPGKREEIPEGGWPDPELGSLASFLRRGKHTPSLKFTALLFSRLRECTADDQGLLGCLKRWMRKSLLRPERWWRDGRLGQRLQQATDLHRNPTAHTGRLTPLEARKALEELWGNTSRPGLIPTLISSIEVAPVPKNDLGRSGEAEGVTGSEIRKDLVVNRVILLKPRIWLLDATDREMGDRFLLTVLPGRFDSIRMATDEFKARRQIVDDNLLPLEKWFQADHQWGRRIVVASSWDAARYLAQRRKKARPISFEDAHGLAIALATATSALHRANLVHGYISPYMVFRDAGNRWLLGGQSLLLLTQRGCSVYMYPRVVAPEVDPADPRTLTPATDVFAIAATVCCLRAGRGTRNAKAPSLRDVDALFPQGLLRTVLGRSLLPNPSSRFADSTDLLAALTGNAVKPATVVSEPHPVVISYSRKDEKEAEQLMADLEASGIRAWRDKDMIPGGVQWREAIVSAIDNCRVVVFLVSKNSMKSEQVPKELDIASDAHKIILPVCLDDAKITAQFRFLLAGMHRLDFFTSGRTEGMSQLLRALREHGVMPRRDNS